MNTNPKGQRRIVTPSEKDRRIMSVTERENLKNYVEGHEEDNREDGNHYVSHHSSEEQESIKRIKKTLRDGEPEAVSGNRKAALERRANELKVWLVAHLVPRSGMNMRQGPDPRFRQAVNLMVKSEMSAEFQQHAQEWKNLMRQIDPEDPTISNLENIRPD